MFFYLTTLNLAWFLKETAPQVEPPKEGQPSNSQAVQAVKAWKHSHFLCHKYDLNGFVDSLYNEYCKTTTVKELWESSERKYKTKDADTKKMTLCETFQVDAIIEKLPQRWVEFKNYLKHKRKEMSVEDLVIHIRKRKNDKKNKGKAEYLAPKARIIKQKFQGTCYNCDQPGQCVANYRMSKRVNPRQANIVNNNVDMIDMVCDVVSMISEVKRVSSNNSDWWVDNGAIVMCVLIKVCFTSFRAVNNGEKLNVGNTASADIKDERDVILKMTFKKELKLTNVLYVLQIHKNLVSSWLLNKFGFRLVCYSERFVLSKNQVYVGKGYTLNAYQIFILI
nr:hypothetical protein [Tanacetum cinerariifolium]